MSRQNSSVTPVGFTLIELLVVVATIGLLAALLLSALNRVKASAKSATCMSNLHQIGIGLCLYVNEREVYPDLTSADNFGSAGGVLPSAILLPYCGSGSNLFRCPSARLPSNISYMYNESGTGPVSGFVTDTMNLGLSGDLRIRRLNLSPQDREEFNRALPESRVLVPSDMIAFVHLSYYAPPLGFGWPGGFLSRNSPQRLREHHPLDLGLFCDGHVESSNPDLIPHKTNIWDQIVFTPDAAHAQRWNNDNQPHVETWEDRFWGTW
jgi:competence protein ComGC